MLQSCVNFLALFTAVVLAATPIAKAQSNASGPTDQQLSTAANQGKYAQTDCYFSKHKESKIRGCTHLIMQRKRHSPSNRALAYFKRGSVYREQGDYGLAISDYTNAIRLEPRNAVTYHFRARAYRERGEYDLAIADYTSALKIDPRYAAAYVGRGNAYHEQEDFDRAIADYTRALKIDPRNAAAYAGRGKAYRRNGIIDRANSDARKAKELTARKAETINRWTTSLRRFQQANQRRRQNYRALNDFNKQYGGFLSFSQLRLLYYQYSQGGKRDRAAADQALKMIQGLQWGQGTEAATALSQMTARMVFRDPKLAKLVRQLKTLENERAQLAAERTATSKRSIGKGGIANKNIKVPLHGRPLANELRLDNIRWQIRLANDQLASDFPKYSTLAQPKPVAVAEVKRLLKPTEALVLFLDTHKKAAVPTAKPRPGWTSVWVFTKDEDRWVWVSHGSESLKDRVDALRCGLDGVSWLNPIDWPSTTPVEKRRRAEQQAKRDRCRSLLNTDYTDWDRWDGKKLPFSLQGAHELYRALFGQVEDLIKDKDLLIVPSGPLTQLPFQVLLTKKPNADVIDAEAFKHASWMAKAHAMTVLPAVSSLKALRGVYAKASAATKAFIGIGNPLLDGNDHEPSHRRAAKVARSIKGCATAGLARTAQLRATRLAVLPPTHDSGVVDLDQIRIQAPLPETADELCQVARTFGAEEDEVYLGGQATEAAIKMLNENGGLAQYKVIHFATHGALTGEIDGAKEPGLILSPPERATSSDDGYLSASEIAGLKLDADWVILSACNTASGDAKNAEALSGLAKAFFYAGARSLLVSHWYIDSAATVALVTNVFEVIKHDPKIGRARALQNAMLSLISTKNYWHPADWAPFVVVGEGAS